MTQHMDAGSCSVSFLPRATYPRLSSSISSPLCPPFFGTHDKWPQMKFCALALSRALCISRCLYLANSTAAAFHRLMLSGFLSGSGAIGWGAQIEVYTLHCSGGTPRLLKFPSGTSVATCGSPASPLKSPLHSLPITLC